MTSQSKKSKVTKAVLLVVLIVAYIAMALFIFSNSFVTPTKSTHMSRSVSGGILDIIDGNDRISLDVFDAVIRKVAHLAEFFVLGLILSGISLTLRSLSKDYRNYFILPLAVSLITAASDETIQIFTRRGSSVLDVLLEFFGSVCAILFIWLIARPVKRRRAKKKH